MLTDTAGTVSTENTITDSTESDFARRARLFDARTCEITLTRERAYAAFRAIAPFQCEDETRFHLAAVALELDGKRLQLVATDGHTLGRIRVPTTDIANDAAMPRESRGAALLASESVKTLIKALSFKRKADGDTLVTIAIVNSPVGPKEIRFTISDSTPIVYRALQTQFVHYSQVIPSDHQTGSCYALGINPTYLARACDSVRTLGREPHATTGIKLSHGGVLDPVRMDWRDRDGETGEFLAVIMPMRL